MAGYIILLPRFDCVYNLINVNLQPKYIYDYYEDEWQTYIDAHWENEFFW